jgi:HSP20 family protein
MKGGTNTMALKELIPWKRNDNSLAVRRGAVDPFEGFSREMDRMFESFLSDFPGRMNLANRSFGAFMPTMDVKETEKEIRITAELPGMEQKDVEVTLTEGILSIKGEKREEHEEEKGDTYRSERRYGAFERSIPLPVEVNADKVKAEFKKGVLKIVLPKSESAQANRRRIQIEG